MDKGDKKKIHNHGCKTKETNYYNFNVNFRSNSTLQKHFVRKDLYSLIYLIKYLMKYHTKCLLSLVDVRCLTHPSCQGYQLVELYNGWSDCYNKFLLK